MYETKSNFALTKETLSEFSIDVMYQGKYITNVVIELKKKLEQEQLKLGTALLQILQPTIPHSVYEYIKSIKDYPKNMFIKIDELLTALEYIGLSNTNLQSKIVIMHDFRIFRDFRGMKLSKFFMGEILKSLKNSFQCEYVVLQPFPYENDKSNVYKFQEEINKLELYYSKIGFQYIPNKQLRANDGYIVHYMYMKLTDNNLSHFTDNR